MVVLLIRWLLAGVSTLLVMATALPFIRTDEWWIRIFDFPRVQLAVLLLASLIAYAVLRVWRKAVLDVVMAALVMSSLVWVSRFYRWACRHGRVVLSVAGCMPRGAGSRAESLCESSPRQRMTSRHWLVGGIS